MAEADGVQAREYAVWKWGRPGKSDRKGEPFFPSCGSYSPPRYHNSLKQEKVLKTINFIICFSIYLIENACENPNFFHLKSKWQSSPGKVCLLVKRIYSGNHFFISLFKNLTGPLLQLMSELKHVIVAPFQGKSLRYF